MRHREAAEIEDGGRARGADVGVARFPHQRLAVAFQQVGGAPDITHEHQNLAERKIRPERQDRIG